jgi:hypothetical protein
MRRIQPEAFEKQVYAALKAAFSALIAANSEQSFYVFGLFTDDSLQFLYPVANTEEALTATVARYREKVDPKYGGTSTRAGMRWSYGDWGFFPDAGGESFNAINEALSVNFDRMMEDDEFDGDLDLLWPAMLKGFQRLEAEGFFGTGPDRTKFTLLLVGQLPADLLNSWAAALNPSKVVEQYMNWDFTAPDDVQP